MEKRYDLIIVGAGPAGLAAAIYMARAQYRVLLIEKENIGGQITITSEVVNYPGVKKISGKELTAEMHQQAEAFGSEFLRASVTAVTNDEVWKKVITSAGTYEALSVLIATGANPRKLGFQGEVEFQGRGIAYCATCDGEFFSGRDVFVIGGGFAAAEEAVFLTRYARQVTVVMRGSDFSCAASIAAEVKAHPGIKVIYQTEVLAAGGDAILEYVRFRNKESGEVWEHRAPGEGFGLFVFAGYVPASELFKEIVEVNEQGYILTDERQETSAAGIYAAGDICVKTLRQVVTAVSDGAVAATSIEKYVAQLYHKHTLPRLARPRKDLDGGVPQQQPEEPQTGRSAFYSPEMVTELKRIFGKFPQPVILAASYDQRPVSAELRTVLEELAEIAGPALQYREQQASEPAAPVVRILDHQGRDHGVAFHGVPGGHEFNSFIMTMYRIAGGGEALSAELLERIGRVTEPVKIKIVVSLSCTMCPGLVMEAQYLALQNPQITAEVYDMAHFPELQKQYKIMSVPCMIINDEQVYFGKKDREQILSEILKV